MLDNFNQCYTVGVNHHDGQDAQTNFFICSSALLRAFLLAKEQIELTDKKPALIQEMFNLFEKYGRVIGVESKTPFVTSLLFCVNDLGDLNLKQQYEQLKAQHTALKVV